MSIIWSCRIALTYSCYEQGLHNSNFSSYSTRKDWDLISSEYSWFLKSLIKNVQKNLALGCQLSIELFRHSQDKKFLKGMVHKSFLTKVLTFYLDTIVCTQKLLLTLHFQEHCFSDGQLLFHISILSFQIKMQFDLAVSLYCMNLSFTRNPFMTLSTRDDQVQGSCTWMILK